jgi:programmed cell death protein 5
MLAQILDNQARERLSRIAMVKPEKARAVEDLLLKTAQRGGLRSKVTEPQLIGLLGEIAEQQGGQERGKITFDRRRMDDSDTDDSDY